MITVTIIVTEKKATTASITIPPLIITNTNLVIILNYYYYYFINAADYDNIRQNKILAFEGLIFFQIFTYLKNRLSVLIRDLYYLMKISINKIKMFVCLSVC